ncbi:MAG: prepilin-type N-terminal cleavage/methylation domain-containing protein [bacterium]|nr:prepilin-type N-terminal cleavage/methylation domain-containing protein [bacterium]
MKGFTLLELVITVSILVLIGSLGLASFVNSRNVRLFTTSAQDVVSVLRLAQAKALAGEDNSVWSVHLEQNRFSLFRGSNYAASTLTEPHDLPSAIEIMNINLAGGGPDVVFKKIDGRTDNFGSFDVRVRNSPTQVLNITVEESGRVYKSGPSAPPSNTRILDTRHRSFNLGWTIQGTVAMTLTFEDPPNPNTIQLVPIVVFMNADQTTFDWTGTVVVGGQNQTLRIHTTSVTGSNTVLSIDRDCRQNNKRMNITIDTRDIATYEANCQTVTVGTFGGTVSEP